MGKNYHREVTAEAFSGCTARLRPTPLQYTFADRMLQPLGLPGNINREELPLPLALSVIMAFFLIPLKLMPEGKREAEEANKATNGLFDMSHQD